MNCLLCLEVFLEEPLIKINTLQTETEEFISDIIKKHFWLKPKECIEESICTLCWKILGEFHQFYLRVKERHNDADEEKRLKNKRTRQAKAGNLVKKCKVEETTPKRALRSCRIKEEQIEQTDNLMELLIKAEPDMVDNEQESVGQDPFDATTEEQNDMVDECLQKSDFKCRQEKSREHDAYIKEHFRLKCNICESALENFDKLKRHFRKTHNIRGYAFCCGRKFLKRGLLADHIHVHQDPKYFACEQCGKVLADRYSMENHTKITHGEKRERVFKCTDCGKSFFNRQIYERHLLMHIPEEKKQFICTHCQKP